MDQKYTLDVSPDVEVAAERFADGPGEDRQVADAQATNGHGGDANGSDAHAADEYDTDGYGTERPVGTAHAPSSGHETPAAGIPVQRAEAGVTGLVKAGRGRPSLGGQGRSPQVTFRAPPALRAKAEQRAARDGKTVSQLAREAFEMYLTS